MNNRDRRVMVVPITFLFVAAVLGRSSGVALTPSSSARLASASVQTTPVPDMMFDPTDRLAPPPMSDPPTQVESGHYVYYLVCMVCHGDRGQGFTDEWRGALDPEDQNCWQSKCHGANHPPEGFELPRYAPPVIGPGGLGHYQTAAGLYEYIRTRMPWHAPGSLSDAEYWQLTAFLADANGASWGGTTLGPENAAGVRLGSEPVQTRRSNAWPPLMVVGVLLLLGSLTLWRRSQAVDEAV